MTVFLCGSYLVYSSGPKEDIHFASMPAQYPYTQLPSKTHLCYNSQALLLCADVDWNEIVMSHAGYHQLHN